MTRAHNFHADDNSAQPDMGTQPRHDEIRWKIEQNVTDVEKSQTSTDLVRTQVKVLG